MKEYLVKDIKPDIYFSEIAYLDKSFVLASPEMIIDDEMLLLLKKWYFDKIFSAGEPQEYNENNTDENGITESDDQPDAEKIKKAEEFYSDFLTYTENLFVKISLSDELPYNAVNDKVKNILDYIKEDRRFLMRVIEKTEIEEDKNFLYTHSARSALLAMIIGTFIKIPHHRLIELGIAAILHEIGMLKLPPKLYSSTEPLSPQENKALATHTILGYDMLKKYNFPVAINLTALEHHEREDGSGYPRGVTGYKISLYSKVIAVACTYETLSSKYSLHKKQNEKSTMAELLKNENKQYDDTIIKALIMAISMERQQTRPEQENGNKSNI